MMRVLVLGAGPAGLSFATKLLELGNKDFLILEKESEAGGLCRSVFVDNAPIDIGGGHFLDYKNELVKEFLFRYLPENEWNLFERDSRIYMGEREISHPLEANIWQLDIDEQIEYLISIAKAGCNTGVSKPEHFVEWIYWKLGTKIAEEYMIPYNRKMFSSELDQLGTYWMEKLPNVSFEETLRSCLERRAYGKQPGHARFLYPKKFGYGEVWTRIASELGGRIQYNSKVMKIDFSNLSVTTSDNESYKADIIISTIPWVSIRESDSFPMQLKADISKLKNNSVRIDYIDKQIDTIAHWIYVPDKDISYHRILARQNFYSGAIGYWTETNLERVEDNSDRCGFSYVNEYAYPLNTIDKPDIMNRLITWAKKQGVIGLGRWGEHQHFNSDITVERALKLAELIANG